MYIYIYIYIYILFHGPNIDCHLEILPLNSSLRSLEHNSSSIHGNQTYVIWLLNQQTNLTFMFLFPLMFSIFLFMSFSSWRLIHLNVVFIFFYNYEISKTLHRLCFSFNVLHGSYYIVLFLILLPFSHHFVLVWTFFNLMTKFFVIVTFSPTLV
jgi:hypothetical protein